MSDRRAEVRNVEAVLPALPVQEEALRRAGDELAGSDLHGQIVVGLEGAADPAALAAAWQRVVASCAALRTALVWRRVEKPMQVVYRQVEAGIDCLDWRGLAGAARGERLALLLDAERDRGLDAARPPLLRLVLCLEEEGRAGLVCTYHRLALDAASVHLLLRQLLGAHAARRRGGAAANGFCPQRDYLAWLKRQDAGAAADFWRGLLDGFSGGALPEVPPAPAGGAAPAPRHWRHWRQWREHRDHRELGAGPALAADLERLAAAQGLAMETLFLGAWALLLHSYTGQRDVVFTIAGSGRPADLAGAGRLVGPFAADLPLRVGIADSTPLLSWLRQLQARRLAVARFAAVSPQQVGAWNGRAGTAPLALSGVTVDAVEAVDAVYAVEVVDAVEAVDSGEAVGSVEAVGAGEAAGHPSAAAFLPFAAGGLRATELERREGGAPPLALRVRPGPRLLLRLEFDPGRFDAGAVERMLGLIESLLASFAADPARSLGALPRMSPGEQLQLAAWNRTATCYPRHRTMDLLFAEQVARAPAALAAVFDRSLTYGELDDHAGRLAGRLRRLGVEPEVRCGIFLERSADLVIALVAVVKAGGAYVPLDPSYPRERLAYLLADSGARVVLTWRRLSGLLPAHGAHLVLLDEAPGEPVASIAIAAPIATAAPAAPAAATPDATAYVIYTSGSTGQPKGVAVPQRAVVRLVRDSDYVQLTPADRVAQASTPSFDAATFEIWGALLNGARLVGVPREVMLSPRQLAVHLRREGITTLFLTTALFNQVVREEPAIFGGLRHLLFGGEAVDPRQVRAALQGKPPERLLHVYGPTETTTFASWHLVTAVPEGAWTVPIGLPIANTEIHLVDARLDLVRQGVAGELCIGGDGLAAGYWGHPDLTAEKFVPDPFAATPGRRLYRTGDLGRRRGDGAIEFLGRHDDQVKLRGFRIELAEIAATLRRHPAVAEAAVVVREDRPGERRIVAYLVGAPPPAAAALRSFLAAKLPDHMVPSAFVALPALPLTPNGKVDRQALPAPAPEGEPTDRPRNAVEEVVAAIWAEVLGRDEVGVRDDFFALGGHSLMATQIVSRLRLAFQAEVPLRALFEAPTVAGVAAAVAAEIAAARGLRLPPLAAAPRRGELPLSFAQERLWFLHQLEPESPAYNMPVAFRLSGRLDRAALAASLSEVVRRHESLRTTFAEAGGRPVQRVSAAGPVALPQVDLRALAAPLDEARRLARAEARRPFSLASGPLLRATLLDLAAGELVVLFTLHHVISDGWSMGILVRETAALYRAFAGAAPSPLAELPLQYADFAAWQRGWLDGDVLAGELAYWRERLAGAAAVLELPADRPRSAAQRYLGAAVSLALPEDLSRAIRALGRRQAATPFMTLLAAFQILLHRYSGQDDVVVGTPIAGRTHLELEGLIGFFVNTLVLRAALAPDGAFADLSAAVRETVLGAYLHQHLPFEKLVDELQPERSLSHSPLFQVMFALQNAPLESLTLPGAVLSAIGGGGGDGAGAGTAQFDLSLDLGEDAGRFVGALTYDTDLFDRATARRLLGHYQALLEGIVAPRGGRLAELPLLRPQERHQLVREWNDTATSWRREMLFQPLFEAQVERTPRVVAAVCDGRRLTYGELNRRANRVAWRLLRLGVAPDAVVPVLVERGLDFLAAVLGVLKAGAAYLPLDPLHPPRRWAQVLAEAAAPLVIVAADLEARLRLAMARPGAAGGPRLAPLEPLLAAGRQENPPCRVAPAHLAYSIFTSGSTGVPKGPMVDQRGMVNHVFALVRDLGLTAGDRMAQTAGQCFDISVWQLLGLLLVGGRVCILRDEVAQDGPRLLDAVERERITVLEIVPSLLRVLLEETAQRPPGSRRGRLAALRWLIPTGEALPPELARQWLAVHPGIPLLNAYGPAECADDVCCAVMRPDGEAAGRVTIGRPLANVRLLALDRGLRLVPPGVAAELCIGGDCVGRGYRNDPRRTAAAFVPDPFAAAPGARLYRTGDRVRQLPDGRFAFLGRLDHQVKIRGFRIELEEIEAVLTRHPGVAGAAVAARQLAPGDEGLVAYFVPAAGAAVPALIAELRESLRQSLPDYMMPAAFAALEALPLSPSGKVDRRRLPAPPEAAASPGAAAGAAPRTPAEELLAGIWADVLGRRQVGRRDNFFAIGGHSLLATRVLSRVRQVFALDLPLRALFEAPTLQALAARIETARQAGAGLQAPPLLPVPRDRPLPLSFAQERLWFLDQLEPRSAAYNMALAYRFRGELDLAALAAALGDLERRHEVLRTTFAAAGGDPFQVVRAAAPRPLAVVDLAALPPAPRQAAARRLIQQEARRPFDLARGPLLRAAALRLAADDHALQITIHHIACDGWSLDLLARDLTALYRRRAGGEPAPLPELPVQYADFAAWQRGWLQGEALERQIAHWRERLAGAPPLLALPLDRPRPAVRSPRGASVAFELSAESSAALQAMGRQRGLTPFMTLLAAFQAVLCRHSGQDDVVVGTPIAGRNRLETEGLIGFFVNTLALRSRLLPAAPLAVLLDAVRDTLLDAYTHQDVPFEKLVHELGVERHLGHSPVFQVTFAFQNNDAPPAPEMAGLELTPLPVDTRTALFDLALEMMEIDGRLTASLRYAADLFDRPTVVRLADRLRVFLEGARAATPIAELPLLPASERQQLVAEWSPVRGAPWRGACLHEIFAAQAARTPDAVAVVASGASGAGGDGGEALTYAGLDRRANRLARRLRRHGVGPEVPVLLCLERSPRQVIAILAVLKAGGAYVPAEPGDPRERRTFVLHDSRAPVVISERPWAADFAGSAARVICLDGEGDGDGDGEGDGAGPGEGHGAAAAAAAGGASAGGSAPAGAGAQGLAYVIYTSGSTGRPKGVLVQHDHVARLFRAVAPAFGFGERDVWTMFHSYAFDFSVWEIWGALLHGGRLVLVPYLVSRSPDAFHELLLRQRVTILSQTPSAFGQLAGVDGLGAPTALRRVVFGGEALDVQSLRPWLERHGDRRPRLINMYGITETTVHVTHRPVAWADLAAPGPSPIGGALADLYLRLADRALQLVPIGAAGEICVGGEGLARGYLDRPDLTAERFVPDPFGGAPGARLYRSGDEGSYRPDGELRYQGRIDRQVKLRGFRIELGDIEAALAMHPAVRQGVVVLRAAGTPEARLAAYLALRPATLQAGRAEAELRAWLGERLPAHMVPAAFVVLEEMPLTASGKVDRRALPALGPGAGAGEGYVAPRTPAEGVLAAIWAQVLEVEQVGATDDFFALGGHSLLAVRLISRVRAAFGAELPLRALFEAPTVAALAARLAAARTGAWRADTPPLGRAARGGLLPLSFAQERLWFLDQLEPASSAYNIAAVHRFRGPLDLAAVAASLQEVLRRHEVLRTVFATVDGTPVQVVQPPARLLTPLLDLGGLPPAARQAETHRQLRQEARRPFDLARAPLLRAAFVRLAAQDHLVLFTVHHIAADGGSMEILGGEVAALYEAAAAGLPARLAELPIQYADYAAWQRGWLTGEVLAAQLAFWREQLAGAPPVHSLPADRPRPAARSARGAMVPVAFSRELSGALRALSRGRGLTLFMTLLAGFQALLARTSGEESPVVGTPVAGRNRLETENLVGFFVNTLVLRPRLAPAAPFATALLAAREAVLEGHAHQDLPFEKLVEELAPERSLGHAPLFQVMLVVHAARRPVRLRALEASGVAVETGTAQFDLTLDLRDGGEHLGGGFEYSLDLFDRPTIERLAANLEHLLAAAAAQPDLPVGELPLLSQAERRQVDRPAPSAAASHPAPEAAYLAPRDAVEIEVARIWEDLLDRRPIGVRDGFFAGGGHSLLAVRLLARIEARFGRRLPLAALFREPTVEALAALLRAPAAPALDSLLVTLQRGDDRPFFCVHPSGGHVFCYLPLSRRLGPGRPFHAFQARGVTAGGEADESVEAMAARYVEVLLDAWPAAAPYRLGGWSMGGVVAFEMAQQLVRLGREVERLALVDAAAPGAAAAGEGEDELAMLVAFAQDLGLAWDRLSIRGEDLRRLAPEAILPAVIDQARQLDLLPPDMGTERIGHLYRVFRAHVRAMESYRPRLYPGRVTLFRAAGGGPGDGRSADLGWGPLAGGGIDVHGLTGSHFTIVREPAVEELARMLGELLA
jgi:amino acid adenylation domain-containing protein